MVVDRLALQSLFGVIVVGDVDEAEQYRRVLRALGAEQVAVSPHPDAASAGGVDAHHIAAEILAALADQHQRMGTAVDAGAARIVEGQVDRVVAALEAHYVLRRGAQHVTRGTVTELDTVVAPDDHDADFQGIQDRAESELGLFVGAVGRAGQHVAIVDGQHRHADGQRLAGGRDMRLTRAEARGDDAVQIDMRAHRGAERAA